MKLNNLTNRKENVILIAVTIFLILGFITLINYNYSITGYTTTDSNETLNESSEAYDILIQDYYFRTGYMDAFPVWPPDDYSTCNNDICFYFNVSNTQNETDNCTLYLNIDGAGFYADTFYDAPNWTNMSDGIDVATELGAFAFDLISITTNGSDFWIVDGYEDFIYHLNSSRDNQTDGVNFATECGAGNPTGITTNGSDFWIVDSGYDFVYHLNSTGDNQTDGFDIGTECGAGNPTGITTNGSDFWIVDIVDDFVYHLNSTGDNQTDGFDIGTEGGGGNPRGITTNGSDFWIVDDSDDFIYHLNSTYDNQTDGIDIFQFGAGVALGITTPSFIKATNGGGTPREFYILDSDDIFVYHIKRVVAPDVNHSICKTFTDTGHTMQWKIACYTNDSVQVNTSTYDLTLRDCRLKVNITFPKNETETYTKYINFTYNVSDVDDIVTNCSLWLNIDKVGYEANETTDDSITEIINQTFNKTFDISHHDIVWKVGCYNDRNENTNASAFKLTLKEYQAINLLYPEDNTETTDRSFSFTYNVSDSDSDIDNCTLYLNLNNAGYNAYETYKGTNWTNKSDGFSTATFGSDYPYGITTNGSDFWIIDYEDIFIYHLNSTYDNQSDGFDVAAELGATAYDIRGITTNGTDFWITDVDDDVIYHLNSTGDNQSDSVNLATECGSDGPLGITTNGSDFWIIDSFDDVIYHLNSTGDNQSDSVNLATECSSSIVPVGITTNGSDFWITDNNADWVYHLNSSYDNQSDGFDIVQFGIEAPYGITTPSFIKAVGGGGTPHEFWIVDLGDDFIYHIKKQVVEEINHTFNKTFDSDERSIYWKVGCYSDDSTQVNSTAYYLSLITSTIPSGPANDPYIPPLKPEKPLELPPPAEPAEPDPSTEIGQQVDEMNIDPGFNSILKELLNIDLDMEPRLTIVDILNKTLLINIGDETEINIDYSKKKPTLLIKGIPKGTKPKLPSILKNLTIFLIVLVSILILYFIIQYLTPTIYKEKYRKKPIKKIILKPIEDIYKTNQSIIRFNKLLELIKQNILENNLTLANNYYEDLLQVYNFLILRLNEEEQSKLYHNTKDIYNLLKQAIEINFYKKSLKK